MDTDWNSGEGSEAGDTPGPEAGPRRRHLLVPKLAVLAVSIAGVLTAVMHTRWEAQLTTSARPGAPTAAAPAVPRTGSSS